MVIHMTVHLQSCHLSGRICVPPSKSMAHRILLCAGLAQGGISQIENLDYSVDVKATIGALEKLGASLSLQGSTASVHGVAEEFLPANQTVNCAESGSTLRFIIPLFSLSGQRVTFTGASRLFARPLSAYQKIFSEQGLVFEPGTDSLTIQGAIKSGEYTLPGNVSSQFISGLLFALPLLEGDSRISITPPFESASYVELTRRAQRLFGVSTRWEDSHTLFIPGGQKYKPKDTRVEGDWSQAAVPAVISALLGNIQIEGLSEDSVQGDRAILSILEKCGAKSYWNNGVLTIQPATLPPLAHGDIDVSDCPDLGPILCTWALFCKGDTRLVKAGRLRIKESDRIASVQEEIQRLGGKVSSTESTITVSGSYPLLAGQRVSSHNDHRIVMAMSAAALMAGIDITIDGAEAITKSWPHFFEDFKKLGMEVEEV